MEVRIGTTIDETIEILSVLGSGGMGTVYKGFQRTLEKPVAIKVLSQALATDQSAILRFKIEAESLSVLDHPNVLRILRFGVQQQRGQPAVPYLVLEFVDGGSLQQRLAEAPLKLEEIWTIFAQITAGVAAAHAMDIIHRDIKPSNIMFSGSTVKIVDFGISKSLAPTDAQKLTQTGALLGTPLYMSPEQLVSKPPSKQSDVYSIGCVLYEMLYSKPYMSGESIVEIAVNQMSGDQEFAPRTAGGDNIPKALRGLLAKMLDHNPANRPADAAVVNEWLGKIRQNPEDTHGELGLPLIRRTTNARRPKNYSIALIGIVALCLCAVIFSFFGLPFDTEEKSALRRLQICCDDAKEHPPKETQFWSNALTSLKSAKERFKDPAAQALIAHNLRELADLRMKDGDDDVGYNIIREAALLPAPDVNALNSQYRYESAAIIVAGRRCITAVQAHDNHAVREAQADGDKVTNDLYTTLRALNYKVETDPREPNRNFLVSNLGSQLQMHQLHYQHLPPTAPGAQEQKYVALHQANELANFIKQRPEFFDTCDNATMQTCASTLYSVFTTMRALPELQQFTGSLSTSPLWQRKFAGNEVTPVIWQGDAICSEDAHSNAQAEQLMASTLATIEKTKSRPSAIDRIYLILGKAQFLQGKYKQTIASLDQGLKCAQERLRLAPDEAHATTGDLLIWKANCYGQMHDKAAARRCLKLAKESYSETTNGLSQRDLNLKNVEQLEEQLGL